MAFIFRSMVSITILLTVVLWAMPYFVYMWFSNEQLYLLDQSGTGSVIPASELMVWGQLVLWLSLSVGLFFYSPAARTGFIVCYILSLIVVPLNGVQVYSPYEALISGMLGLADGAV